MGAAALLFGSLVLSTWGDHEGGDAAAVLGLPALIVGGRSVLGSEGPWWTSADGSPAPPVLSTDGSAQRGAGA